MSDVPWLSRTEQYALGLLAEECGEALQLIGKALRFGLDKPGSIGLVTHPTGPRPFLALELGDILAAVDYACIRGVVVTEEVIKQKKRKLEMLLTHVCKDGGRLAP